ncbi:right-handed parallel beta-helix repeat-containing protein [Kineococcus rhizosphaerae]|uniref:Parallel beta helix pectate lyase-like protein n=1 Tax=Kineococcus rhizosphaerae TaxID=559628 RepID=A0A2T0R6F8_9ACTN|nr:right-handed parallel beta-helix repeat-containing protein [Kineococcus rhizosphaerae]PRY16728.1 parallel beta helix pectate lyase-like protein [Kineococcus rhizosphaerae]
MRTRTAVLAAPVAVAAVLTSGPAAAAVPRTSTPPCGSTLVQSVRLASDVVCPDGGALTLAADGVELNLNGHRLVGPGAGGAGVVVAARDVVVRNGTITGWGAGVLAAPADGDEDSPPSATATARALRIDRNGVGVSVGPEGSVLVRDSWITGSRRGGDVSFGGRLRVENSTVADNTVGLWSFSIDRQGLVVRGSVVRGSSDAGIACGQDGHYDVAGSTLQRNGTGVYAFECNGRVVNSRFVWNTRHVDGFLVDEDVMELRCDTYSRDGLPLLFPATPCS